MIVKTTWHNANPETVWNKLAARLGRQPTNQEAATEIRRILQSVSASQRRRPAPRT